jgi:hypothetical protein
MVEGMSTALAAIAKWAKTPNLLGDIVGCVVFRKKIKQEKGNEMLYTEGSEAYETKDGGASACALRLPPRHLSRAGAGP